MILLGAPWFLLLGLVLPLMAWWHFRRRPAVRLTFPSVAPLRKIAPTPRMRLRHLPAILRLVATLLFVFALARPQTGIRRAEVISSGVDIVLAIDASGSMKALDFELAGERKTRLEVSKSVVEEFIDRRKSDRLGMVVFGTSAFTQSPLTLDHGALQLFLRQLEVGAAGEETAIGDAIGMATKRLKDLKAKSKIIILLTDGVQNAGMLKPETAAEAAASLGIKIYTVAVGSREDAPFLVKDPFFGAERYVYQKVPIDEELLKQVAAATGGRFFRATDTAELRSIYGEIDRLEKTETKVREYANTEERFAWVLVPALLFLILELLLRLSVFRQLP